MSDDQDSLKDKQLSRREFLKLLGAGSLSLGLGVFGISNVLKTFREASAITEASPPLLNGVMNNTNITSNNMNKINSSDIRPFQVNIPETELIELRRRINATRWPDRETVTDSSQGVQLATMQKLARYWATDYNWRKVEAKLNALPQFITEIDGLDIHFIHVRSKHKNALPLIVTHGWPGSIIEQLKIIDPLTNPTAHGASASDAFHLVIPSMPGYGFSGKPTSTGWGPERMARAWAELMKRLCYARYVAQGGDWGAFVVDQMGLQAPAGLLGIHTNMPATVPVTLTRCSSPRPAPSVLSRGAKRPRVNPQSRYKVCGRDL